MHFRRDRRAVRGVVEGRHAPRGDDGIPRHALENLGEPQLDPVVPVGQREDPIGRVGARKMRA